MVGSKLSFDFYNHTKGIIIEVQGSFHQAYNKWAHGNSKMNFLKQLKRDDMKVRFCEINNLKLVEVWSAKDINVDFFSEHECI